MRLGRDEAWAVAGLLALMGLMYGAALWFGGPATYPEIWSHGQAG